MSHWPGLLQTAEAKRRQIRSEPPDQLQGVLHSVRGKDQSCVATQRTGEWAVTTTESPQPKRGKRGRLHGQTPRGRAQKRVARLHEGRFARMFDLAPAPEYEEARLAAAADGLRESESAPTPDQPGQWGSPTAPPPEGDNAAIPAAFTYFGQFVDHDVTFDATSRLGTAADPDALTTFRSPRFDLDSLYGSGPVDEPFQYDDGATPAGQLLLDTRPNGELDLPRNAQGTALIGDPRNDENTIISQLQVAFIRLHNRVLRELEGVAPEAAFDEARRVVRWHYQLGRGSRFPQANVRTGADRRASRPRPDERASSLPPRALPGRP